MLLLFLYLHFKELKCFCYYHFKVRIAFILELFAKSDHVIVHDLYCKAFALIIIFICFFFIIFFEEKWGFYWWYYLFFMKIISNLFININQDLATNLFQVILRFSFMVFYIYLVQSIN